MSDLHQQPDMKKYISPFEWPKSRKIMMTTISCISTLFASFAASSYSPASEKISAEFGVSEVAALVGLPAFSLGFAVGPMFLAPFSEIHGRKMVFLLTSILFTICQLCCAVTQSYGGMLAARFFAGVGGSTFSTMVGGIIADMFHAKDRNTPMVLFSFAAISGIGFGALVCGFIAQHTTWRWIFYMQTIIAGLVSILVICLFYESRGSVLLSQKARTLNKWYEERERAGFYGLDMICESDSSRTVSQRIRWKVASDEERASLREMLITSLLLPTKLLFTEPVVFFFSLWAAFSYWVLYLTLSIVPLVFQNVYDFSLSISNSVFAASCIGSMLMAGISVFQERVVARSGKLNTSPERRLYFACVQSICLPIGLFMFGWSAEFHVHWIVPAIALGISTMGIFSIYLAVFNYLADTYHCYSSSALAAQSFCRNLGGIFPLISRQMFKTMTYGGASSLLGGVGLLLTLVPWTLVFYGPRIRARSKFASEMMDHPN